MNKKYRADKVVITEFLRAASVEEIKAFLDTVHSSGLYESMNLVKKPALAYKEINKGRQRYTLLSGAKPFDSYAEAEAARLQFIKDYCIEGKETFEI